LKLGVESDHEEAVICLDEKIEPEELIKRINEKLTEGLIVTSATETG